MRKKAFSITRKDFEIQTFRSGGKGGQHQNTCESGVRIIHHESGARGECRNFRSQKQNKDEAFKRLVKDPKFKIWLNRKLYDTEKFERELTQALNQGMCPENLKFEIKVKNGKWVETDENLGVLNFDAKC
jgi:protein subunit release factor B